MKSKLKEWSLVLLGGLLYLGLGSLIAVPLLALFALFDGYVIHKLWEWFIVPVTNVRPISVVEGIGISIFIGYLYSKYSSNQLIKNEYLREDKIRLMVGLASPVFALVFGYVVKTYFM